MEKEKAFFGNRLSVLATDMHPRIWELLLSIPIFMATPNYSWGFSKNPSSL